MGRLHHLEARRGPHGGTQGLGAEGVGAAGREQHALEAEGGGAAQKRAHVAGVLHPLQRQQAAGHGQVLKAGGGAFEHAEHALVGGALRQLFGHVLLHQIILPAEVFQCGGLFQGGGGIIYYL